MASIGHVVVGLALARAWDIGQLRVGITPTTRERVVATVAFCCLAMLPDADVIGFRFGVAYASEFGHRGASHAIVVAAVVGVGWGALLWRGRRGLLPLAVSLAIAAIASHGLLDCLTDGGEGVALFWPISHERFFAPWNPIPVAPIGRGFLSLRGLVCAGTELLLFSPVLLYALLARGPRPARHRAPPASPAR